MIQIEIEKEKYQINDLQWSGNNPNMVKLLDDTTQQYFDIYEEITPSEGDPDYVIASNVITILNGKITKIESDSDPNTIY